MNLDSPLIPLWVLSWVVLKEILVKASEKNPSYTQNDRIPTGLQLGMILIKLVVCFLSSSLGKDEDSKHNKLDKNHIHVHYKPR